MSKTFFLKSWRQRIACAAALMMLSLGIATFRDHEERGHVEGIPSIPVASFAPESNVSTATVVSLSSAGIDAGFVVPESTLHQIYIKVG
jgi:hypothetical protein